MVTGDSDTQWCGDVADGYRLRATSLYWAAAGRLWEPATNQRFVAILGTSPDSWAVCAVLAPGLELYSGSLVRSLARPTCPCARLVVCRTGGRSRSAGFLHLTASRPGVRKLLSNPAFQIREPMMTA